MLTKRTADRHAVVDKVAFKYVMWSWKLNDTTIEGAADPQYSPVKFKTDDELTCAITVADTETAGNTAVSTPATLTNKPPVVAMASIDPPKPYTNTAVTCSASGVSDPEGDQITITYRWLINSTESEETDAILPPSAFIKGDELRCVVTPHDEESEGVAVTSQAVKVLNTAPEIASVSISPDAPTEESTLSCTVLGTKDLDGDKVTITYQWIVNDQQVQGAVEDTLNGAHFDKGDQIRCAATPEDTETKGVTMTSGNKASAVNTAPLVGGVTLTPAEGGRQHMFTCAVDDLIDPDPADALTLWPLNDDPMDTGAPTFTYRWLLNDQPIDGVMTDTFTPSEHGPITQFGPDDLLRCGVIPFDGQQHGPEMLSSTAMIINNPPSITGATLSPEDAFESSILTCTAQGFSDINGDTASYTYAWNVAGGWLEESGETINGASFSKADLVFCTVTPGDGVDSGDAKTSNIIKIKNTAPVVDSVTLSPDSGGGGTIFTCSEGQHSDADDDDLLFFYSWWLNGELIDSATETEFTPEAFTTGDLLTCAVVPFDLETKGELTYSAVATLQNLAPSVATVTISPQKIYNDTEDVTCAATGVEDPDGDTVTLTYQWLINGFEAGVQATLSSDDFSKHDKLLCVVTPKDKANTGAAVSSAQVTVLNTPPTQPVVAITPSTPKSSDETLTCLLVKEASDSDDDTLEYTYEWFMEGESESVATDPTVATELFDSCATITCTVTATDGEAVVKANAEPVILDGSFGLSFDGQDDVVTIPNSSSFDLGAGPATMELWLKATTLAPMTVLHKQDSGGDRFTLSLDADGAVIFQMTNGGVTKTATASAAVQAGQFHHIAVVVAGSVMKLYIDGSFSAVSIAGTSLSVNGPLYLSGTPAGAQMFEGVLDEVKISTGELYIDDFTPAPVLTTAADTMMLLHCEGINAGVTDDASGEGNAGTVNGAVLTPGMCGGAQDLPPSAPEVEIQPTNPTADNDLTCVITTPGVDPEGGSVTHQYYWRLNGYLLSGLTGDDTVPANLTKAGQSWQCEVIANDGTHDSPLGKAKVTIPDDTPEISGTYSISPYVVYYCAESIFGGYGVSLNYGSMTFDDNGTTLTVTSPKLNNTCWLTSPSPAGKGFAASCFIETPLGGCSEYYYLDGTFNDDFTQWTGTLEAHYVDLSGWDMFCSDCTQKTWQLTGTKQ